MPWAKTDRLTSPWNNSSVFAAFAGLVARLRSRVGLLALPELLDLVLEESGYRASLMDGSQEGEDRWANLLELREVVERYADLSPGDALDRLLEETALVADQDAYASGSDAVTLITLHAAKGLEFDEVFLVGVEDGSLPHASSREDDDAVEEERRLMYVGMTRARDRLTLSLARRRMVRGEWSTREPSPFLSALPAGSVAWEDLSAGSYRLAAAGAAPSRDGGLFPDYEGESQETPPPGRRPAGRAAPPRFAPMRRTPPPPSASGFRRGSRVKHPEYGAGVVLALEGSGDAEKVTVYFERAGKRKFVARFANLSPG